MRKRLSALALIIITILSLTCPVLAASLPKEETPEYKVAYYAFDCFNMRDENGKKYGYGYEMMQNISDYLQCTFSYVGYDKSASECIDMLRDGELDIYTAAKKTPEREEEFAFSTHPAITATTCMNVKRGNNKIVAGDYSTYNGIKIGLLQRHTYNDSFIEFTKEKGFQCEIKYYKTPTELSKALIDGEVDALVNSYIRTPEDEMTVENFGETPYYFMARKEDQDLIDKLDYAIDCMNVETPNWRSDLYNTYYGSQDSSINLTDEEEAYLEQLKANKTVIRAAMHPDRNPYSWFEEGKAYGIVSDIFAKTAQKLGLDYEIVSVSSSQEYKELVETGKVDVWMDVYGYYDDQTEHKYKLTEPYLTSALSVLRNRGSSSKIEKIGVLRNSIAIKEILENYWSDAEVVVIDDADQCVSSLEKNDVDGVLLPSYMAQMLARENIQNRLVVEVVPGATISLKMGINADDSYLFYGIWSKTLASVAQNEAQDAVQSYLEVSGTTNIIEYLFDHPVYMIIVVALICFTLFMVSLYIQSNRAKKRQQLISEKLAVTLQEAKEASDAKSNFFSKMSHDIRTPLNGVIGLTQIAKKYRDDPDKLEDSLERISSEGMYLLNMINSILDINQLEHGHMELVERPFKIEDCVKQAIEISQPLAEKKNQTLSFSKNFDSCLVLGDSSRYSQIVVNIISNAIKYTDEKGLIKVSLEQMEGNRFRFICSDNGIGMKKEYIQHICEDYSRAEDSRISATEGTGLGMAVVKGFTDLMKGSLSIESELGEGSTFTVEIPFKEPSKKMVELEKNKAHNENDKPVVFKDKKVLLVEDNSLNAEIAMELLESIGFAVDWAENGKSGLEKFEASEEGYYFAIFMDMQMPVMDGIEATRQIRAMSRNDSNIRIYAMTANAMTRDRKLCEDAGMDGFISKPINLKVIEKILTEEM